MSTIIIYTVTQLYASCLLTRDHKLCLRQHMFVISWFKKLEVLESNCNQFHTFKSLEGTVLRCFCWLLVLPSSLWYSLVWKCATPVSMSHTCLLFPLCVSPCLNVCLPSSLKHQYGKILIFRLIALGDELGVGSFPWSTPEKKKKKTVLVQKTF